VTLYIVIVAHLLQMGSLMDVSEVGWEGVDWMVWLRIGFTGGSWKHGNEHSGCVRGGEFLD
jgi:hypothetical protein